MEYLYWLLTRIIANVKSSIRNNRVKLLEILKHTSKFTNTRIIADIHQQYNIINIGIFMKRAVNITLLVAVPSLYVLSITLSLTMPMWQ
jgi:hypothetical protein